MRTMQKDAGRRRCGGDMVELAFVTVLSRQEQHMESAWVVWEAVFHVALAAW